jgi:hypothetical protein
VDILVLAARTPKMSVIEKHNFIKQVIKDTNLIPGAWCNPFDQQIVEEISQNNNVFLYPSNIRDCLTTSQEQTAFDNNISSFLGANVLSTNLDNGRPSQWNITTNGSHDSMEERVQASSPFPVPGQQYGVGGDFNAVADTREALLMSDEKRIGGRLFEDININFDYLPAPVC